MENEFNFVYLTVNTINGKCYVGSHHTKNENLDENRYYGSGVYFKKALKKYKKENFCRIILKMCDSVYEARNLEEYYIKIYDTLKPNGYNISPTGGMDENCFGKHSDETKKLMSEKRNGVEPWNKGKKGLYKHSEDSKKKISEKTSGENNPMYGKTGELSPLFNIEKSEEHKQKISLSKKGDKNPNANEYKIITPDGKEYKYKSATKFVENHPEYKVNRHFIYSASKSKKTSYKGWKCFKCLIQ